MTQAPLFANIAELYTLSVFTFLSSRFTVASAPFKVIAQKTNQLTCHSFTEDLYLGRFEGESCNHLPTLDVNSCQCQSYTAATH